MNTAHATNQEQAARWNGLGGRGWVEAQALVDRLFKPIEDLLADAVAEVGARHVLDVGCGTGGTTLAMQRGAGAEGHATGVDISEPMIAAARSRAARDGARASFFGADAQTHTFAPARFDLIASRFGVMFFDDPVAAFTNLRHAVRPVPSCAWPCGAARLKILSCWPPSGPPRRSFPALSRAIPTRPDNLPGPSPNGCAASSMRVSGPISP